MTSNPEVVHGTPCFAGTRVPVATLFDYLDSGTDLERFHESFPSVDLALVHEALSELKNYAECSARDSSGDQSSDGQADHVVIEHGRVHLTLWLPRAGSEDWYSFHATLRDAGMTATTPVTVYGGFGIDRFFQDLLENSQGWNGKKVWGSTEGNLYLSASIDRLGHIKMEVTLKNDPGPGGWTAETELVVEAGAQLTRVCSQLASLFEL